MKIILVLLLVVFAVFTLTSCNNTTTTGNVVKTIDIQLTEESYAFVVKKGNTELVEDFNAFLTTIKENGTFDEIVAKYFEGKGEKKGFDYIGGANTANDENTFVVATNCPFEPFEYISNGLMYGIDIEIAQLYAESKELTLVVKNIDFDAIFENVDNGYADIGMAGITINEDRLELYDFTDTYYNASQKLVVAADNNAFDNCTTAAEVETVLASLSGIKIGYQIGTTGNWYVEGDADWGFDGFVSETITGVGYKTAQLAIQDIVNGQLYAVVVDEAPAAAMVNAINEMN